MNRFWAVAALAGMVVLAACTMENRASEYGLYPDDFYGKINTIIGLNGEAAGRKTLSVHSCCEQRPPQTNDGPAEWAVDGITSHWWHSCYAPDPEGYSIDTQSNGHAGDFSNFLMRQDGTHYAGYTWTKDAAKAEGGPDDPWTVGDVVPSNGAHWITLDFGEEIEIGAGKTGILEYYRRADKETGGLGVSGVSFEIYVSKWDFGWIVDGEPGISRLTGITRTAGNTLTDTGVIVNTAGAYENIYLTPDNPVKFRFLQIRWRYTGSSKAASAANIVFRTMGKELDYSYLTAVYIEGKKVLRTVSPADRNYYLLQTTLESAEKDAFPVPEPEDIDTIHKLYTKQQAINSAANSILSLLYKINPPKKPPEVIL